MHHYGIVPRGQCWDSEAACPVPISDPIRCMDRRASPSAPVRCRSGGSPTIDKRRSVRPTIVYVRDCEVHVPRPLMPFQNETGISE
jgi:hypothetical protein